MVQHIYPPQVQRILFECLAASWASLAAQTTAGSSTTPEEEGILSDIAETSPSVVSFILTEASSPALSAYVRIKDTTRGNFSAMSLKVLFSSDVVKEPAVVYAARLAQLAARRAKKGTQTVSSAPVVDKSAESRRPKPFTGEGDQDQADAVRRFCNALSLLFELSKTHPDDWALYGRTYLDGTAADHMHTAVHALPKVERTWAAFCALLGTRFGQIIV